MAIAYIYIYSVNTYPLIITFSHGAGTRLSSARQDQPILHNLWKRILPGVPATDANSYSLSTKRSPYYITKSSKA